MRFQVRASYSEFGPTLWRVWDSLGQVWVDAYTRQALAEAAVARLERNYRDPLAREAVS